MTETLITWGWVLAGLGAVLVTLGLVLANMWASFFFEDDGSPNHCGQCGSAFMTSHCQALGGGEVSEALITCDDCGDDTGYFAYGSYDPAFRAGMVRAAWPAFSGLLLLAGVALWFI